jgi:hypothetical protein
LNAHLLLMLSLRMCGAIPHFHLSSWSGQDEVKRYFRYLPVDTASVSTVQSGARNSSPTGSWDAWGLTFCNNKIPFFKCNVFLLLLIKLLLTLTLRLGYFFVRRCVCTQFSQLYETHHCVLWTNCNAFQCKSKLHRVTTVNACTPYVF